MTVGETNAQQQGGLDAAGSNHCRTALSPNTGGSCFTRSKYFDSDYEPRSLSLSPTSSTTSNDKPLWVCAKCRQATTDPRHKFGKINDLKFYCCDACWRQYRLSVGLGGTFRTIQIHFCFTTLWIPSPTGVFLADHDGRYGEWLGIVLLLIITLLCMIASFINVIWCRPISDVKRVQIRRPVLDLMLELMCDLCWVTVVAVMMYDGVREYGHGKWNGALVALIVCAWVMLLSYIFTAGVAWRNLIGTSTTVINGCSDEFGRKKDTNIWQAIAFLP